MSIDTLMTVSSVCGAIVTIIGLFTLLFKKPWENIKKQSHDNTSKIVESQIGQEKIVVDGLLKEMQDSVQALTNLVELDQKCLRGVLRHEITGIYEEYYDEKAFPPKVKKDLCSLYEVYTQVKGNSYIHEIYEEMMKWETRDVDGHS